MKKAPIPVDEAARLRSLRSLQILDTAREEQYDRIVRLVAECFRVPIALISLVDEDRQWFKAAHGLAVRETPRDISFCGHAIIGNEPLVVADTQADERFCDNPLVTGDPNIRFYVGQPISAVDGHRIGTICIIDHVTRTIEQRDLIALREFARLVENELNNTHTHEALEQARHNRVLLEAQRDLAVELAMMRDPGETLPRIIQSVCEKLGWSCGNILLQDSKQATLRHAYSWPAAQSRFAEFIKASQLQTFSLGLGLPGRVWNSRQPAWIADLARDRHFQRASVAAQAGLHSAFAIPVTSGGHMLGVMECFGDDVHEADRRLLDMLGTVGELIGETIERKNAEKQLMRLTMELNAIFSLSSDGFLAFDKQGATRYINPALLHMLEIGKDAAAGLTAADFDSLFRKRIDGTNRYIEFAHAADGTRAVIQLNEPAKVTLARTVRLLHDAGGDAIGMVVYFRDITHEAEVDRMKSEFLSTAAHELRTPMASIHGFSELLLNRDYDDTTRKDLLATILRQSTHLVHLVDEMLDLARIEARRGADFKIKPNSLFKVVREIVDQMIVGNDPRKVVVKLPKKPVYAAIDREKFAQVLLNILSNAYKYSPGGGPIELTSRTRAKVSGKQIGIAVRDHGLGMNPEEVGRVFDRFYRANALSGIPGTGLGMSVAKEIMDIHGGDIEIFSKPGEGTEVVLWIPIANKLTSSEQSREQS